MAKNLKLNIKNTQLAQALNLGKVKGKLSKSKTEEDKAKEPVKSETVEPLVDKEASQVAATEEEPRRVKARSKNSPPPKPEETLPPSESEKFSLGPTLEESNQLQQQEEERKMRIAKSRSFLQEDVKEEATPIKEEAIAKKEVLPKEEVKVKEEIKTKEEVKPKEDFKFKEEKKASYEDIPVSPLPTPHTRPAPSAPYKRNEPFTAAANREDRPYKKPFEKKPYPSSSAPRAPYTPKKPSVPFGEQRGQKDYVRESFESRPEESRVKLGPTGKHVKDLIKPRPAPTKPHSDQRPPRRTGPSHEPRVPPAEVPKTTDGPVRQHTKKTESETTEEVEVKKVAGKGKEFLDLKPLKKQSVKGFDARDRQGLRSSDDENWRKRRPSKAQKHQEEAQIIVRPTSLKVRLPISIKDLALEMKLKASELIAKLFMQGVVVTLNDLLDDETTVQLLGQEFGCDIQIDTKEEERIRVTDKSVQEEIKSTDEQLLVTRAPVVTFMGHVDHGKTSLIDSIRKSNRVASEAGAITQHIGAFRCKTKVGDIAILDTPGHEAFSAMRARGANVTDIVVLVVAGDEGMKQQTIEAMNQAKEAKVTIVVAINKCDKPNFNAENVYQQLATHQLLPEAWGGETITVNCSATTGEGIDQLLEMLALQAEVLELKANPSTRARGSVLESELHKGFGPVATILIQNGTLKLGDAIVFDHLYGRIKTMQDERGANIQEAGPSTPVSITGLSGLPEAGSEFIVVKSEKEAKEIAEARLEGAKRLQLQKKKVSLENLVQQAAGSQKKIANFILRADVQGSLEALKASLLNIRSNKIEVNIIYAGVGEISESDIELAAASQAILVGFHTQVESHADSMIKQKGVKVVLFDVIYHAIEEVKKILVDMLDKIAQERELGHAEVLATFKASQLGVIAGCIVQDGVIQRNQKVRLVRNKEVIWKGGIASLKRVKEDVKEVKKGLECGILLQGFNEAMPGDIIQCYEIYYLTQDL